MAYRSVYGVKAYNVQVMFAILFVYLHVRVVL